MALTLNKKADEPKTSVPVTNAAPQVNEPETGDDEAEETEEIEGTKAEKGMAQVMSDDDKMTSRVNPYVSVMDKDTALSAVFQHTETANRVARVGTFLYFLRLIQDFPLGSELAKDLPEPDSTDGNNPDKYKKNNDRKTYSFYGDLFDRWNVGASLAFVIRQCELAMDADTRASAEEKYKQMELEEIEKLLKNTKEKQRYGRGKLKQAASVIFQLERMRELKDKVMVTYPETIGDADSETDLPVAPFTVRDATTIENNGVQMLKNPGSYMLLTVEQFLQINVPHAVKLGGSFKAVQEALKPKNRAKTGKQGEGERDRDQSKTNETAAVTTAQAVNLDNMFPLAVGLTDTLRTLGRDKTSKSRFLKGLMSDSGDRDLLAIGNLYDELTAWFDQYKELLSKYRKLDNEEADTTGFDKERKAS